MATGTERARQYADQVRSGEIVAPNTVKQAVARFFADFDNDKFYFDGKAADAAVFNIERFKHAKGRWQNKPVVLEPWQCFVVANLFGWKLSRNDLRRFRKAYIRVPRKNGKSTLAILIALVMFGPDMEPGAEVYLGATGRDQANELLFYPAKFIAQNSEAYCKRFGVEVNAQNLVIPANFSKLRSVIKKPPDGSNPHCAVVDEYHEHEDDEQVNTFETGMGSREQPLMLITTTAGSNLSGPCKEFDDECLDILAGKVEDDTLFTLIYALDDGDQWDDLDNWIKVNPCAGVSVSIDYLADQLAVAKRSPRKQNELRTKHCNEWVGAATAWLNILLWQKASKPKRFDEFKHHPCYGAVDLASHLDANAVSLLFRNDDGEYYHHVKFYVPEGAVQKNPKYQAYVNSGDIIVTPGNATDQQFIENDILELEAEFDMRGWAFDKWQAQRTMCNLQDQGLYVVEYGHTVQHMSPPMKEVEAMIVDGRLFNDGNQAMTWMMGNVVCFRDIKDNIYPRKPNKDDQKCKIDGPVSLIMAMGMWLADEDPDYSHLADPIIL